jgi:prevent-host-death family protein
MTVKTLSAEDVRAHLAGVIDDALRGKPTAITRRGRPVAAIIDIEDLHELQRLRKLAEMDRQFSELAAGNGIDLDTIPVR